MKYRLAQIPRIRRHNLADRAVVNLPDGVLEFLEVMALRSGDHGEFELLRLARGRQEAPHACGSTAMGFSVKMCFFASTAASKWIER